LICAAKSEGEGFDRTAQTALSPVMTHYQFWLYTDKSSRKLDVRFFFFSLSSEGVIFLSLSCWPPTSTSEL